MTLLRFASSLLACTLLAAPFGLVAVGLNSLVEPVSRGVATALVRVGMQLQATAATEPEVDALEAVEPVEPSPVIFAATSKGAPQRAARPKAPAKPAAIFVSEATVLKLAAGRARPRGSFVAQTPQHPAGLRLSAVAGLGIGVQEGDILTEAVGSTPRSPGQVIGAIIEARAKQPRFLSGRLWRQGQTFAITVEQPYVAAY